MITRRTALAAGMTLPFARGLRAQETGGQRSFTILHTNDIHGRHVPFEAAPGNATSHTGDPGGNGTSFERAGRIGGFAALAAAIKAQRDAIGAENIVLVDAGDTFSDDLLGTLTQGEAIIRMMKALDYDFMALGNHEFDFGIDRLRELAAMAEFPMRGANVIEDATGQPLLGDPVRRIEVGGIRVALVALGYHNSHLTGNPANTKGLTFQNGTETMRALVPTLRPEAEVVVVVSHQGKTMDRKLLEEVEGIDLVIGGHSHDLITPPERIGGGWMVQALSDCAMLGRVTITVSANGTVDVTGVVQPLWLDEVGEDEAMAAMVADLRAPHRDALEAVIATAADRIGRQHSSESPFDQLVGRILREETGAEIAFMPGVGYGVSLNPGPITREALAVLLPHPSGAATLTLTGAQIREILEQTAANQAPEQPVDKLGGVIQTDGIRWTADLLRPIGDRLTEISVGDAPLDPERRYRVVANASMLNGLHRYDSFAEGEDTVRLDRNLFDIVEASFRKSGTVSAPAIGDMTIIKKKK